MRKNKFINEKGLTLIEVIISVVILGILVLSFLSMFSQGITTIFDMGHKTGATRIAQQYMDEYYADPTKEEVSDDQINNYVVNSSIDNSGPHGTKKITVTVTYRNATRSTTLTALVP